MNNNWLYLHLEKIRIFEAVGRSKSIIRAADELRITQPAISRALTKLEQVSGRKLLERSRLGSRLTTEGKILMAFAKKLDTQIQDCEKQINDGSSLAGHIKIGSYESFATSWWPKFIVELKRTNPELSLSIRTAEPKSLREELLSGALSVVIEAEPLLHESLTSVVIGTDYFGLFLNPKLKSKFSLNKIIENFPLIYVPTATDNNGSTLKELVLQSNTNFSDYFELETFSAVKEFVMSEVGIGILPLRLSEIRPAKKLEIIRITGFQSQTFGKHRICMSYREENTRDKRVQILKTKLKSFLKK